MKQIESILLIISPNDPLRCKAFLECAIELSHWLQSKLQVIAPRSHIKTIAKELQDLATKNEIKLTQIDILHEDFSSNLLDKIESQKENSLLLKFDSLSNLSLLGPNEIPVLILPHMAGLTPKRIKSLLVPVTGNSVPNQALNFAMDLGKLIRLPIDLFHVTHTEPDFLNKLAPGECGHDQLYHEYSHQIEQWISQSAPYCSIREKFQIRKFYHSYGDLIQELIHTMDSIPEGILILEWTGSSPVEKSPVLHTLLYQDKWPIFLVKTRNQEHLVLKVGERFSNLEKLRAS